jgi:hypothetical protein
MFIRDMSFRSSGILILCITTSTTINVYNVNMHLVKSTSSCNTLNQFMTKSETLNVHNVCLQQVPPPTYQNISIKAVHDKIKDMKCSQCEYVTYHSAALSRHIKGVHDKIKDKKCSQCEYVTSYTELLARHRKKCKKY